MILTVVEPAHIAMWQEVLGQCGLVSGNTVILLIGANSHPGNVSAAAAAVLDLGLHLTRMELGRAVPPAGGPASHYGAASLAGNRPAIEAMKSADLVIDLLGLDRGTEQEQILAQGTRILLVKEPPEILARLLPSDSDRSLCNAAAAVLEGAQTMHVTSAAGTDFRVCFGEYAVLNQYGLADAPGRWDHWPSGFVARWPDEGSAQGVVVIDSGDVILPFKDYVRTPIQLSVSDGYVRSIDGDFDANFLRDYMAQFNDAEGYAVSHLGWGLLSRASWSTLAVVSKEHTNAMEARSYLGCFMFSTGPNLEGGGTRSTPCHLDIPMRYCSVSIDGVPVVDAGRLIAGHEPR